LGKNSVPRCTTDSTVGERLDALEGLVRQVLDRLASSDPRYLTVDGAAAYASMSAKSVRRMLAAGQIKGYRPRPGKVLIDRRELDAQILSSTRRGRTGRGRYERGRGEIENNGGSQKPAESESGRAPG
jgi:excisionase family DNA binding protein